MVVALAGLMLVSTIPAFAENVIVEDDGSFSEDIMPDNAQGAEDSTVSHNSEIFTEDLIEEVEFLEAMNMSEEGELWYCDEREEKEIMQYRRVYQITEL